jgi:hypothetical protein
MNFSIKVCDVQLHTLDNVQFYAMHEENEYEILSQRVGDYYLVDFPVESSGRVKITHPNCESVVYDKNVLAKLTGKQVYLGLKGDLYYKEQNIFIPYSIVENLIGVVPLNTDDESVKTITIAIVQAGWIQKQTNQYFQVEGKKLIIAAYQSAGMKKELLLQKIGNLNEVKVAGSLINSFGRYAILTNLINVGLKEGMANSWISDYNLEIVEEDKKRNSATLKSTDVFNEEITNLANDLVEMGFVEFADVEVYRYLGSR